MTKEEMEQVRRELALLLTALHTEISTGEKCLDLDEVPPDLGIMLLVDSSEDAQVLKEYCTLKETWLAHKCFAPLYEERLMAELDPQSQEEGID